MMSVWQRVIVFPMISLTLVIFDNVYLVDGSYEFKQLGSTCTNDSDCKGIENGICDELLRKCECPKSHTISGMGRYCLQAASLNQTCKIATQCSTTDAGSHCLNSTCVCITGLVPITDVNGTVTCSKGNSSNADAPQSTDFAVLGMVLGLAAMFILICVAVRMFSKERFEERRSIFSSPRLLKNVLAKKSREKNLSSRRGSHARIPSRNPSIYSAGKSPTVSRGSSVHCGSRRPSTMSLADGRRSPNTPTRVAITVDGEETSLSPPQAVIA